MHELDIICDLQFRKFLQLFFFCNFQIKIVILLQILQVVAKVAQQFELRKKKIAKIEVKPLVIVSYYLKAAQLY